MDRHDSQRGHFAYELYQWMIVDKDIRLVVGDLGYKVWDEHFKMFPRRCLNVGAAEQTMMDVAVGMALAGKKPFVYSITPFLLWRAAETIRNYIAHEKIPVRLVGSGRDNDYEHDGFSHYAGDDINLLSCLENVVRLVPHKKSQIPPMVELMVKQDLPSYINLKR